MRIPLIGKSVLKQYAQEIIEQLFAIVVGYLQVSCLQVWWARRDWSGGAGWGGVGRGEARLCGSFTTIPIPVPICTTFITNVYS